MKPGAPMQECEKIKNGLINNGFQINEIVGVNMTILSRSNGQTGCSIRKTA